MATNGTNNPAKRRPSTINFRPKHPKIARNSLTPTGIFGEKHEADYYVADETADYRSKVIYLSFKQIDQETDKYRVASLFASAMCAFAPELQDAFMHAMKLRGIVPDFVLIPSEARHKGVCMEFSDMYKFDEISIFIGLSTMILFKNTSGQNYSGFIKARLRAMAGMLRLKEEKAAKIKFPITFQKAEMIKSVFGSNIELKRSLIHFMNKQCNYETGMRNIARYTCSILSYTEMKIVALITEVLVNSKSPVLQDPRILHEVVAYRNIMMHVESSEYPKFFRFFCSRVQAEMLQRRNFPILGAVAQKVKSMESDNRSIDNVSATMSFDDPTVSDLVGVHERFTKTTLREDMKASLDFLFEDYDYAEVMHEDM